MALCYEGRKSISGQPQTALRDMLMSPNGCGYITSPRYLGDCSNGYAFLLVWE